MYRLCFTKRLFQIIYDCDRDFQFSGIFVRLENTMFAVMEVACASRLRQPTAGRRWHLFVIVKSWLVAVHILILQDILLKWRYRFVLGDKREKRNHKSHL
jgi:hypothetical protein